ncbi:putative Endonuclease/exonuclease/phosphatase domain protein [Paratrimastix pyriformis]|uniref:polynucleotide adenylyltransferase n=1 Tax=Paratrimastix pyriformis TaxID=342808 RepID=A0ABQ8UFN2_9EUKA|nr:putative Endonuclease/exonuclease/phosphatase domain protein [Paratrimastix pyriformis]
MADRQTPEKPEKPEKGDKPKKAKKPKGKKKPEPIEKQKLRTSHDIYHRLKWDPKTDPSKIIIGHLDRFDGMQDANFATFVPPPEGEIPWHRVYFFDRITEFGTRERIWDRDARVDRVFGSGRGDMAVEAAPPAPRQESGPRAATTAPRPRQQQPFQQRRQNVLAAGGRPVPLPAWRFNGAAAQWQEVFAGGAPTATATTSGSLPLRVATWNVLMPLYERNIYTEHRTAAALRILKSLDADLIALQEVTAPFLEALLAAPWVRRDYYCTEGRPAGPTIDPYGQVLLSRLPLAHPCPLPPCPLRPPGWGCSVWMQMVGQCKRILLCELWAQGGPLWVPVVHLTSDHHKGGAPRPVDLSAGPEAAPGPVPQQQQARTMSKRQSQVAAIAQLLGQRPGEDGGGGGAGGPLECVLVGDTNMGDEEACPLTGPTGAGFTDCWTALRGPHDAPETLARIRALGAELQHPTGPQDPLATGLVDGWCTFDPYRNPLAALSTILGVGRRYDRVMVRANTPGRLGWGRPGSVVMGLPHARRSRPYRPRPSVPPPPDPAGAGGAGGAQRPVEIRLFGCEPIPAVLPPPEEDDFIPAPYPEARSAFPLFASDHWGLVCQLEVGPAPAAPLRMVAAAPAEGPAAARAQAMAALRARPKGGPAAGLVNTSAVVLIPDEQVRTPATQPPHPRPGGLSGSERIWGPIQEIRRTWDRSYDRWMPHVNLLYPFLPEAAFAEAADLIRQAVSPLGPIHIRLGQFGYFEHARSSTTWLRPDVIPGGADGDGCCGGGAGIPAPEEPGAGRLTAIQRLQRVLEGLYPQCNELALKGTEQGGFTPHCSVGAFKTRIEARQRAEQWQPGWRPLHWTAREVCLIARSGDGPFRVVHRIPLAAAPAPAPPTPAPAPASVAAATATATATCGPAPAPRPSGPGPAAPAATQPACARGAPAGTGEGSAWLWQRHARPADEAELPCAATSRQPAAPPRGQPEAEAEADGDEGEEADGAAARARAEVRREVVGLLETICTEIVWGAAWVSPPPPAAEKPVRMPPRPPPYRPLPPPAAEKPVLFTLGSHLLGVAGPGSDLDLLCIGPGALQGAAFLEALRERLVAAGGEGLEYVRLVADALVPVCKLRYRGLEVDLQYASYGPHAPAGPEWWQHPLRIGARSLRGRFDGASALALAALHEAPLLLQAVPDLATYRALLRAVRAWAKARGVSSCALGFYGGISHAITAAAACLAHAAHPPTAPGPDALAALVRDHFAMEIWGLWKPQQPADWRAPVLSPVPPHPNTARHVTRSTALILKAEWRRAAALAARAASTQEWAALFEEAPFFERCPAYLILHLRASSPLRQAEACGWMEVRRPNPHQPTRPAPTTPHPTPMTSLLMSTLPSMMAMILGGGCWEQSRLAGFLEEIEGASPTLFAMPLDRYLTGIRPAPPAEGQPITVCSEECSHPATFYVGLAATAPAWVQAPDPSAPGLTGPSAPMPAAPLAGPLMGPLQSLKAAWDQWARDSGALAEGCTLSILQCPRGGLARAGLLPSHL